MNDKLKHIIEEKFQSKAQQRFFFAKCNDEDLSKKERKKWCKWAGEFSDDTDFESIPDVAAEESEIEEIVDFDGSIPTSKIPKDVRAKSVMARKTSDQQSKATSQPPFQSGQYMKRYWGESEMDDALGFDDTMGKNLPYDEALKHFMDELGFDESDAKERLEKMGYMPNSEDKVRIVEKITKKQIEEYVDQLLDKKSKVSDVIEPEEVTEENSNPILDRKVKHLLELPDEDIKYIIKKLQTR